MNRNNYVQGIVVGLLPFLLLSIIFINFAIAVEPPDPGEIKDLQQKNLLKSRIDFVKNLGNHKIDGDLLKNAIRKTARTELRKQGISETTIQQMVPEMAPPSGRRGMPTVGTVNVLVLLIEFTDNLHTNSSPLITDSLFGAGNAAQGPYESLKSYYSRASYNKLNLSGTTLGWYQAGVARSLIATTTTGREDLIKQALNYYHAQGMNFSQYDNNGDGVIDYLVVIWTGADNGWGNFWWGYQTYFSDSSYQLDGVRLGKYSWQWEGKPVGSVFTPRVVIHETGHALGLPDYYDYDESIGPKGGVGGLDIMDANWGDHNCFSKWVLDWISPKVISAGTMTVTMNASGTSEDCVLIWPNIGAGDIFREYFVVQNRQRAGNDTPLPADGMLIWHVDASLDTSGQNFQYDNSFTAHKLVRLMEADGLEEIEKGLSANAGDYYKLGRSFSSSTLPSSKSYNGSDSRVEVYNISNPGSQMTATFRINRLSLSPPRLLSVY